MENAEQILVVVLSAALALFLILAIMATVKIIQILNSLKRITEKAEEIADKAESISEIFKKSAAPLAFGRLMAHVANTVFSAKKTKRTRKGK